MKIHIFASILCIAVLLSSCGTPAPATTEGPGTTEPPAAMEAPVTAEAVIFVVDDFDNQMAYKYESNDNCLVRPDGQKYGATGTGLEGTPTASQGNSVSHGVTVYEDLLAQSTDFKKEPLYIDNSTGNPDWMKKISVLTSGQGKKLIVVGVDTKGYTTTVVRNNIISAINFFEDTSVIHVDDGSTQDLKPVRRFVVNMSFAIVPCALMPRETMTADEYIREIGNFYATIMDDPLHKTISSGEKIPSGTVVVFVAAAGNLGQDFDFPFAPAIWDSVISVSAEGDYTGSRKDTKECFHEGITNYSNCGEVKMNGDTANGGKGTSYAAPKFSYRVALYLMENMPDQCTVNNTAHIWNNLDAADEIIKRYCAP